MVHIVEWHDCLTQLHTTQPTLSFNYTHIECVSSVLTILHSIAIYPTQHRHHMSKLCDRLVQYYYHRLIYVLSVYSAGCVLFFHNTRRKIVLINYYNTENIDWWDERWLAIIISFKQRCLHHPKLYHTSIWERVSHPPTLQHHCNVWSSGTPNTNELCIQIEWEGGRDSPFLSLVIFSLSLHLSLSILSPS